MTGIEPIPSLPRMPLAALVRYHRGQAGLTQEQLAARAGLSVYAVSTMERGAITRPHAQAVALLADALGLGARERPHLERAVSAPSLSNQSPPRQPDPTPEAGVSLGSVLRALGARAREATPLGRCGAG